MSLDIVARHALIDDANRDECLRCTSFQDVTLNLTCQVLLEPGYILEEDCDNEAKRSRDSGREFYDKDHLNSLFNSIKAMGEDPPVKK